MKSLIYIIIFLIYSSQLYAERDTVRRSALEFGMIPILAYDEDLGLKYGLVFNYFRYPKAQENREKTKKYSENLFFRLYNTTRNTFQAQTLLESDLRIRNAKVFIEFSHFRDKSFDFYGFNGYQHRGVTNIENTESCQLSDEYFQYHRVLSRVRFDLQKKLKREGLRFLIGVEYLHFKILTSRADQSFLNSLFEFGANSPAEINGGSTARIKAGLIFENRDNQCYCSKGQWIEVFFPYSINLTNGKSFSKFIFTVRDYRSLKKTKNLVLMSRLSVQLKTHGQIPFYQLSEFYDSRMNQEGVGGAFNLRGLPRARVLVDGFTLLNLELRRKIFETNLKRKSVMIELSGFSDQVTILQKYIYPDSALSEEFKLKHYSYDKRRWFQSVGLGLYFILNRNNVININYGRSIFQSEKSNGLYIGSSFLF